MCISVCHLGNIWEDRIVSFSLAVFVRISQGTGYYIFLVFVDDSIRKRIFDDWGAFLCRLLSNKGIVSLVTC